MAAAFRIIGYGLAAAGLILLASRPAHADLKLCNRLSYVVETAIGVEDRGAAATRGWVRLDPGECRGVLQGPLSGEHLYVHARALPLYGPSPMPQGGHVDLCVADQDFVNCHRQAVRTRPASRPLQRDQAVGDARRAARRPRRGGRLHRRAGAARRHPAPPGDLRLRRQSDRWRHRPQDRGRARAIPQGPGSRRCRRR